MSNLANLRAALGEYHASGDELLFFCPFCHHHKRKLSVNSKSSCWKCWICDERGRSLFSLFWRTGHRDLCPRVKQLDTYQAEDTDDFVFSLPEKYISLAQKPNKSCLAYLTKRQVSKQQILRHKIGYCAHGRYQDRIILPSFSANGRPNFFTARSIRGGYLRYINPKTPSGYKKSVILNELNIDWKKPVIIVEGFFDMLRVPNATPILAVSWLMTVHFFRSLVMRNAKTYVCLDPDARQKQLQLLSNILIRLAYKLMM